MLAASLLNGQFKNGAGANRDEQPGYAWAAIFPELNDFCLFCLVFDFTVSIIVNYHCSPPFGGLCLFFYPSTQQANLRMVSDSHT